VVSVVPQGGHLSPLLYHIFMNEAKDIFKFCKFLFLADDFKRYTHVNTPENFILIKNNIIILEQ
jgi:hypothetical protein